MADQRAVPEGVMAGLVQAIRVVPRIEAHAGEQNGWKTLGL
jgi:hypothetical protein